MVSHIDNSKEDRKESSVVNGNPRILRLAQVQRMMNNSQKMAANRRQMMGIEDRPVQAKPNNTGLLDNLKTGVENLSGYSMDDVKVHYNSNKPVQLQAHAYTQGTDIHVAPSQNKHLPHEAWHVVQQKQVSSPKKSLHFFINPEVSLHFNLNPKIHLQKTSSL